MIDKIEVSQRFFSCYPGKSRSDMARIMKVRRSTVTQWATKAGVPWSRLKYLADSQAVSWDWILEGTGPKESLKEARTPRTAKPQFSTTGINLRYLSLFGKIRQKDIADRLGVTSSTVSEWKKCKSQVPWERLEDAAEVFGVRWDWLLDGLEPKYREGREPSIIICP